MAKKKKTKKKLVRSKKRGSVKKRTKASVAPKKKKRKGIPFEQKDLLTLRGLSEDDLLNLFKLTDQIKKTPQKYYNHLRGKTLGLLFQKPSCRTRVSFGVGMAQMGGQASYLSHSEIQMGDREPIKDVARTLSGYFDGFVLRTQSHTNVKEFAQAARVPVINGLSDFEHIYQLLRTHL